MKVEHEAIGTGVRFGPYLGGAQARSAAAALNHVYPYRYATTRSGAERDMARVRGVLPGDGARMREAVVASSRATRRPSMRCAPSWWVIGRRLWT